MRKKNFNIYLFLMMLLGALAFFCSPVFLHIKGDVLMAKSALCKRCQKPIIGQFVSTQGHSFHPKCFLCDRCKKQIAGHFQKDGKKYYHPDCFKKSAGLICYQCRQLLNDHWAVYENEKFHKACLNEHIKDIRPKCGICRQSIEGKYTSDDDGNYHIDCYKLHKLPKCSLCFNPLDEKYIQDSWGNRSHIKHMGEPVVSCSSCQRIISAHTSEGGYQYGDGRNICGICYKTAMIDSPMIAQSKIAVLNLLLSAGITDIPATTPIYLVDKQFIKKKSKSRHAANTKGFTECITKYINNKRVSVNQTVFLLSGLPKLEFEGVLAHEFLHVWLNRQNINMSGSSMEGFCNLGAMLVYQADGSKFAKVLLNNMDKDPDLKYGRGYRRMKKKLETLGWERLIKRIGK